MLLVYKDLVETGCDRSYTYIDRYFLPKLFGIQWCIIKKEDYDYRCDNFIFRGNNGDIVMDILDTDITNCPRNCIRLIVRLSVM